RQSRRAPAEGGDHSGKLVAGDRRCSVTVAAIGPGGGPLHLSRDESRRMNLNDDVVYGWLRLGPLHPLHPGRSPSPLRPNECLPDDFLPGHLSLWGKCWSVGKVRATSHARGHGQLPKADVTSLTRPAASFSTLCPFLSRSRVCVSRQ